MPSQVIVLDAGGQYCHLIARKVREAGVSAEVRPSETPASELKFARAIIISGGPSSVYEAGSPTIDPTILSLPSALLGICYGQQLMAHLGGGRVEKGTKGEYGLAVAQVDPLVPLFDALPKSQQVWMSHRDLVAATPPGFTITAATPTCPIAGMADPSRRLYAVQFHPEVVHTPCGRLILDNFLFRIAGCEKDWNPTAQLDALEEQIRQTAAGRSVFFFVSGGVDSTVAYTLCLRALGPERVWGAYVDTGLMREGETEFVESIFKSLGATHFHVEHAQQRFLDALEHSVEPEQKRHIIGQKFVDVQDSILNSGHFLNGDWILGQGTIYPDTIESGGTAKADLIKTHHNRVAGIQKLIDENRIVEPLASFYKDEVRAVGRQLGLPAEFLERHPFPGPGLAIRCLCASRAEPVEKIENEGWLVPVHSVGVQGDSRSYRPVLAFEAMPAHDVATEAINRVARVNRAMAIVGSHAPLASMSVFAATLTKERLARLRSADAIVRRISHESGFDQKVWQFPVVLIPLGVSGRQDSVVLRPIHSVDGMTAQSVPMDPSILDQMTQELLALNGVAAVCYDLTHKPPATIEWE